MTVVLTVEQAKDYQPISLNDYSDVYTLMDVWKEAQKEGVRWDSIVGVVSHNSHYYLVSGNNQAPIRLYDFIRKVADNDGIDAYSLVMNSGAKESRGVVPVPVASVAPPQVSTIVSTQVAPQDSSDLEEAPTGFLSTFTLRGESGSGFKYTIDNEIPHIAGRSSKSSDIALGVHSNVSRNHAKLQIIDGDLFISDLNSTNGTFVNGVRITSAPSKVKSGDHIVFGDFRVVVE